MYCRRYLGTLGIHTESRYRRHGPMLPHGDQTWGKTGLTGFDLPGDLCLTCDRRWVSGQVCFGHAHERWCNQYMEDQHMEGVR
jgi:hypothetical protein